jgi:adenosine deaminase
MCKSPLHPFIAELPKCEHHLHLEGCLAPKLLFQLATKNNISLPSVDEDPSYASPEALEARYAHFANLDDFLQYYYRALKVLVTSEDFELLAWEYFRTAHKDNVQHAEVFFDPQSHTSRGVAIDVVVQGFRAACARAEREFGLTSRLIMCFLRHLPLESASETMNAAVAAGYFDKIRGYDDNGPDSIIAGIGLDSSEIGFRPEIFTSIYNQARRLGVHRTAHAGEEGDPSYILGALEFLHVARIDHGVRLAEDSALMRRVADEGRLLTVCPLSNVCLQVVDNVAQLPIRRFLDEGVRFSLNSDDPAYFGGYVLKNYCAVQEAFDLSVDEWTVVATNAVNASWIGVARKAELLRNLESVVAKYKADHLQ